MREKCFGEKDIEWYFVNWPRGKNYKLIKDREKEILFSYLNDIAIKRLSFVPPATVDEQKGK